MVSDVEKQFLESFHKNYDTKEWKFTMTKGLNLNFKVYDDKPFTEKKAFYDVTNLI